MDGYGKRVLVAEDDEAIRNLITTILSEAGYNVYEACDGLEAVDSLKKRRYDVLLTDYHMPKMDGLELLDLAQAMWPDLPVVVASSDLLLTGQTAHGLLKPAFAILEKPFDRSELLNTIRSAVHGVAKPARGVRRQSSTTYQAFAN